MEDDNSNVSEQRMVAMALNRGAAHANSVTLLTPRLLAITGLELQKYLPEEIRTHIVGALTYAVAQHAHLQVGDGADILGLLRGILLPEKTDSWAYALQEDALVKATLRAAASTESRSMQLLRETLATQRKSVD